MNKLARSQAKDANQEKLRAEKQAWNKKVSGFIDDLIHFKLWVNGRENKFLNERSKITNPIPNDPASVLNILMSDFASLGSEGLAIIRHQKEYAESRGKSAAQEIFIINKEASNALTRLVSKFKGPIFSGSKLEKVTNKYRISLLKVLSGIKDALRDLQVDILFKSAGDFPDIESEYSKLDVKVDELNSIYKSYLEFANPRNEEKSLEEQDTPAAKIDLSLKEIQSELIKATWLPIIPKRQIHLLNKRVSSLLLKNARSGDKNTQEILVEKNLIDHDFLDLKSLIFDIWTKIFPDQEFTTVANLLKIFSESKLTTSDLVDFDEEYKASQKSSKNFKISGETLLELESIQKELELSSLLPVNLRKETHSLNKRTSNALIKIESGRFNQKDINIEVNLIKTDFKALLANSIGIWRKILLNQLKDVNSFEQLYEKYLSSGIEEDEALDLAGGFPNISKSKDIKSKFDLIVGEPQPTKHFARTAGDGDKLIILYDQFIKDSDHNFWSDFPVKQYTNVKYMTESAKDQPNFAQYVIDGVVEAYNDILVYINKKLIDNDIISVPIDNFSKILEKMPDLQDLIATTKFANAVSYNIAKQLGTLKNKFSLGDKSSGLKVQLSDLFDKHIKVVNDYMNILESRILTGEELDSLSKSLEDFFKDSKTPFKALESSYIVENHDKVDSDSESSYNKILKSVLKSKDKSRIKNLLK